MNQLFQMQTHTHISTLVNLSKYSGFTLFFADLSCVLSSEVYKKLFGNNEKI